MGRIERDVLVDVYRDCILSGGVIYFSTYQGRIAAIEAIDGEK